MAEPVVDISEIIRLPVPDRLRVIEDIWDSVTLEPEKVKVPEWHRQELRRRLEVYESKPREGSPWPEVRERIEENNKSRN